MTVRCALGGRLQMLFKIGILKKFALFTGKHLCLNFFLNKAEGRKCFPVNIAKFLGSFLYKTPPVAASRRATVKTV